MRGFGGVLGLLLLRRYVSPFLSRVEGKSMDDLGGGPHYEELGWQAHQDTEGGRRRRN